MTKYRIVPKRDFGSGPGYWLPNAGEVGTGRYGFVKSGFVVTDGLCNIMPGAAWFRTAADAMDALKIWISVRGDAALFWTAWRTAIAKATGGAYTKQAPLKHWSMAAAIEQIEKCSFECEGGQLKNNDAWRWLVGAAKVGPEFWPGQGVWFEVTAEAGGVKLNQWVHFYIVGCSMDSDSERRFWTYNLSYDPPAPYHYGVVQFTRISGDKLRLGKPDAAKATGAA